MSKYAVCTNNTFCHSSFSQASSIFDLNNHVLKIFIQSITNSQIAVVFHLFISFNSILSSCSIVNQINSFISSKSFLDSFFSQNQITSKKFTLFSLTIKVEIHLYFG